MRPGDPRDRTLLAVERLELPEAVWRTCPWQPREVIVVGLRQWLRCAGAALREDQAIDLPSRAVDEAWHGLILSTARYAAFCGDAYGRFLHHNPERDGRASAEGLARTVTAWTRVQRPGEKSVLWNLDAVIGVPQPWGISADRVSQIEAQVTDG
jgi:hypothetical protein